MEQKLSKKEKEIGRLFQMTAKERIYWEKGLSVCGIDEVGRGPLAGPVVVACAVMPPTPLIEFVNDSKKLSEKRRELLYPILTETAIDYNVCFIFPSVIDEINILEATKQGFSEAFSGLKKIPDIALLDYISGFDIGIKSETLVHGDAISYSIAAASIIAKVTRDNYMKEMDKQYPEYGFAKNKGYGTAEHIAALIRKGPCEIHRRSFVKTVLSKQTLVVSGRLGEDIAAEYLEKKGYTITERNFKTRSGEIDLIAKLDDCIVFVEVKSRSTTEFGLCEEAVDSKKQKKLISCATEYCYKNNLLENNIRFDVIGIDLIKRIVCAHHEAAFCVE